MNTTRLAARRHRGGIGAIHTRPAAPAPVGPPLRGWGGAWIEAIRRRCFGADPREQLWTWFLPNPLADEPPRPERSSGLAASEKNRGANIVLIEPDREARERLRLWLQLDGHLVAEAADESEALKIIAQEPPDLIILELSRSAAQWMEFIVRLNRLRPRPNVRLIGLAPCTAGSVDGTRFFATDVLQHPVRQEELRSAVASAMQDITGAATTREEK